MAKHILIVDDDSSVLDVVGRTLSNYHLTFARDPDEALAICSGMRPFDLLITDYLMPSMTGEELIGHLRAQRPGLQVLILTGHADLLDHENASWWASEAHLAKPPSLPELRAVVARLIGPP
jgi:CheY-like chemotaxis protein